MLWLAPAGLRGGIKLEAYHQSRQPLPFSPCGPWCSGTSVRSTRDVLLRQPYLRPRRGGDLGFVSRHKPAEHPIPDVPAAPDVEASCITSCRGRRVSLSLWKTLRRHSMSAVAAQTMGLSRFAERWSHICPRVPFSPGHCRWLGSISSRCSSPAHYEAHFRSPSAFDEFFLGSQRETTELLRSTHCGFRTSCEDCSPLHSASLQTCSWTRWYAVLPIYR